MSPALCQPLRSPELSDSQPRATTPRSAVGMDRSTSSSQASQAQKPLQAT